MGNISGTANCEFITLTGDKHFADGKIEKSSFFECLGLDLSDYSNVRLTPQQAQRLKNLTNRSKFGVSAAIPIICFGEKCPNKLCPLHEGKNYIFGKQCLIEVRMVQQLFQSYIDDLKVDPESSTELSLVNKLVECDIIDYRANLGLSGGKDNDAASLLCYTVMEGKNGTYETTTLHPLLDAKDRAHRTRLAILEAFASTRREKYKEAAALKKTDGSDSSSYLSELKRKFDPNKKDTLKQIKKDLEQLDPKLNEIIDADWETSDG